MFCLEADVSLSYLYNSLASLVSYYLASLPSRPSVKKKHLASQHIAISRITTTMAFNNGLLRKYAFYLIHLAHSELTRRDVF